ncbi:hypothetical protein [Aureibacter tunicatorum]|uniref:Uncharacterized protein n=1 Tax=Aureibacter tunicatorum TaxID=866807 RepID=A0AAE4BTD2_9BACT|nr:hypothetical protein [Aureibacter tunicatorum]MDR6240671.1 hypothetical protein [Aureibacter tunicatorum]BDD06996.1 hypothetical protein AUTU_44790 [Aureibacter tunicatorum]
MLSNESLENTRAYEYSSRPQATSDNCVSKFPPPCFQSSSKPLQCARLKADAKEWYGKRGIRRDLERQRFVRASIRKSIILPVTSSYPHLTLDIEYVKPVDRVNQKVELVCNQMHYSKSADSPRIFFEEDWSTGEFVCLTDDPQLPDILPKMMQWIRNSGLDIKVKVPDGMVLNEPVAKKKKKKKKATASTGTETIDSKMDELAIDETQAKDDPVLEQEPIAVAARSKPKKKKKATKLSAEEKEKRRLEYENYKLEGELKFSDLNPYFTKLFDENPSMLAEFTRHQIKIDQIRAREIFVPLEDRVMKERKDWEKKFLHYYYEIVKKDQVNNKRKHVDFSRWVFERAKTSIVPKIKDYQLLHFMPQDMRLNPDDEFEGRTFRYSLKLSVDIFTIQLEILRYSEAADFANQVFKFLHEVNEEDTFFYYYGHKWRVSKLKKDLDAIPDEMKMAGDDKLMEFKPTELDDFIMRCEEFWDEQVAIFLMHKRKAMEMMAKWRDMSPQAMRQLDMKAKQLVEGHGGNMKAITVEMLDELYEKEYASKHEAGAVASKR